MLTIVFYATDGAAAKMMARHICADKQSLARAYDVAVWDSTPDACDRVVVMPDVQDWQRARIDRVYGDRICDPEQQVEEIIQETGLNLNGDGEEQRPAGEPDVDQNPKGDVEVANEKKAIHKGGGRWYVMQGDQQLSGPHDKGTAKTLALEP